MQARTNTMLVLAYGVIAVIVMSLVFWSGTQHVKTEQLIAKLNAVRGPGEDDRVVKADAMKTRRSMRPALVRLQHLLEQRTELMRDQQDQLKQQIEGHEQLQQKHEKLSDAYTTLQNEYQLLANEVEFYLNAFSLASDDGTIAAGDLGEDTSSVLESTTGESATTNTADPVPPSYDPQLAASEVIQLRQEIANLNSTLQRDSLIAGYASLAMVEMGPSAVPLLSQVLDDKSTEARAWAAWVLGQIGPDAAVAASKLEQLLDDENHEVAQAAAEALRSIGRP
jgi:cell division protein FtsN